MQSKKHLEVVHKALQKKLMDKVPNQRRAPGEIQGLSKHLKQNNGQGRGQRVKAANKKG